MKKKFHLRLGFRFPRTFDQNNFYIQYLPFIYEIRLRINYENV